MFVYCVGGEEVMGLVEECVWEDGVKITLRCCEQ